MRALRAAPGAADARWPTFLLDAIRQTPMPDFLLYGEPYPALNAIVLTAAEHAQLVRLTETFARIFEKAVAIVAADAGLLERLGFPWLVIELLQRERLAEPDRPLVLGRFDFLLDTDGRWQLLEYNADTPSGARETAVVEPLIAGTLRVDFPGSADLLVAEVRRAFAAALGAAGHPPGAVLGLVTDAGYNEDLSQAVFLVRTLAPALEAAGIEVVLGDVDNLSLRRGRLRLCGRPLDALYRYYPFETLLGQQAFADLFVAVAAGRLHLLNDLRGLLAQNKGLLAWLWERRDDAVTFTPEERITLRDHLPPIRWLRDVASDQELSGAVLKQVFGREGEEVYFGDRLAPADVARCREWGSYVVQQRVSAAPLRAAVQTSLGPQAQEVWPCVGSFTARGRWGGYYTRLGGPITTARAKFVATFWEP